jgi:hypothetical protein
LEHFNLNRQLAKVGIVKVATDKHDLLSKQKDATKNLDNSPDIFGDPLASKGSLSLKDRLRTGILLHLQFASDMESDTKLKVENENYMATCTNNIRKKLA